VPAQFDDQTTQLLLNQLFEELLQEENSPKNPDDD